MPETLIQYPVIIEPALFDLPSYRAYCPDFEDTTVEATTMEEAVEMVTSLITYQVGMLLLKDRNAQLPIPSSIWDQKEDLVDGNGKCYGWANINPLALKMQIRTAELNAETTTNYQQRIQNSVNNVEQAALLGTWLMGLSFFKR